MEVRKGYQQTVVGVIPEDWEVYSIGDVLKIRHGKDQKKVQSVHGIYPILGTGGLMGFATKPLYEKESVLIGRKGTIDKPKYMNTPFWTVDTLFYSELNDGVVGKYIYYKFLQIDWYSHNEASGVPSLNAKTIEKIHLALPPTKAEQTAIATALSDMDDLINSLSTLIEKKKAIKQGAMQQLLKPKEGWVVKKLGEVCDFASGTAHENFIDERGDYVVVNSKFISTNGEVRKFANTLFCPAIKDDILIVLSDVPNGKAIAKCFLVEKDNCFTVNQRIGIVKPFQNINSKFLYYLINRHPYLLAFDDGAKQTNLRNQDVTGLPISVPIKEEQQRIASILSEMNFEIQSLEQNLSKYQMLKQGMMQELLTGKTRLV